MGKFIKDKREREAAKTSKKLNQVTAELKTVSEAISLADRCFNEVEDDDLTEALIYDRSALLARYSFLIKEAKKLELELEAAKDFPNSGKNSLT